MTKWEYELTSDTCVVVDLALQSNVGKLNMHVHLHTDLSMFDYVWYVSRTTPLEISNMQFQCTKVILKLYAQVHFKFALEMYVYSSVTILMNEPWR